MLGGKFLTKGWVFEFVDALELLYQARNHSQAILMRPSGFTSLLVAVAYGMATTAAAFSFPNQLHSPLALRQQLTSASRASSKTLLGTRMAGGGQGGEGIKVELWGSRGDHAESLDHA